MQSISVDIIRPNWASSGPRDARLRGRRKSSVDIIRPNWASSGPRDARLRGRRKRLGTDTSSGSNRSKKTTSSSSSVQKHLPKYIQSLFRGRMSTDPCKRHSRKDSSESNASSSAAVLEFTRQLQNYPLTRKEAHRQNMCRSNDQQDSPDSKARHSGYVHLPELEIHAASPPRSPGLLPGTAIDETQQMLDFPRPSSPQAIPGLPQIEIRRPSALPQYDFGYFVNSPELIDRENTFQLASMTEMNPDFHCIRQLTLNLLTAQEESSTLEDHEQINDEYLDFQDQVVSGSLPCPREEAAYLASIQLCVDEQWPSNKRTQTIRRHLLKGQFGRICDLAQKIMVTPWEVDQNLYCTPPRFHSQNRSVANNAEWMDVRVCDNVSNGTTFQK
ncbi:hypothetical protein TELCIR_06014 [Teladorsagia circumcincta]|uniref:Uncharacterized protein n=1 Tax=Teladorsagia circumcincta TaxID=45464 RepID=A0A2G9URF8_TELCI|nr:hypothetical protein TELCIR_06014 [Teladorsagia circumcincta]